MTLPEGWREARLQDELVPVPKISLPLPSPNSTFRYIDIGSIDGRTHRIESALDVKASEAPSRARQVVRAHDTIFSTVRPYLEKLALVGDEFDGAIASTGFVVLRPGRSIDARYLYFYTMSKGMLDQILPLQRGVSYPAVLAKDVRSASIPVPPLPVQRRIVEIIEENLSRVDASEVAMERVARRAPHVALSLAIRMARDAPLVPLGDLTLDAAYGTSAKCVADGPGVPVVRIPNVVDGVVDLSEEKRLLDTSVDVSSLMLKVGDLLIIRTNGSKGLIGRAALVEHDPAAAFASYLLRYRLNTTRVDPAWVRIVLELPAQRRELEMRAASSAGQYNLSVGKLRDVPVPVPYLPDQHRFAEEIAELRAGVRRQVELVRTQRQRAVILRRALLQAAFSGLLTGHASDLDRAEELGFA